MIQSIVHIALVVRDYDEAIDFYTKKLNFTLIEMTSKGIEFVRPPKKQDYGIVAVFKDLYGNLWDLVQFTNSHPMAKRVK